MATDPGRATDPRPTLAVWKFASCDGCQLTLLDCEDELLGLTERVRIEHFLEMTPVEGAGGERARPDGRGPYDLSLVEGSITTAEDAERIHHIRSVSRYLVTIGACATAGGIQALRNFADVDEFLAAVYAQPEYISTLETSTPISAHVPVDFELRGCPIDRRQLLEVITAHLAGRKPRIPSHSVCFECKRRGTTCITVAHGTPCLGPVTHAGCGAICPAYGRGCYGCFGPTSRPNLRSMVAELRHDGMSERDIQRVFRTFNAASPEYASVPDLVAEEQDSPRDTTEARPERPA
ncbi:NADH-quinone oxidoreductase subunit B family protein [Streptomyces mirabilis]|uniref:NADH-quinone oxidoreductase subunit B family protein n=1 Tax=Streptomyces mirabilis TaxID=68239 RepID=UPI0006BB31C6|nr:oxidoreductase [Streptomyces mirabilis]KPI11056.1 NADH ubiquinone oxidoreductase 20 kDa subunit [Actinobacteria bacterium OK006]MCX4418741.1 oxidoreductase [Streptomyces mirabilis]